MIVFSYLENVIALPTPQNLPNWTVDPGVKIYYQNSGAIFTTVKAKALFTTALRVDISNCDSNKRAELITWLQTVESERFIYTDVFADEWDVVLTNYVSLLRQTVYSETVNFNLEGWRYNG